MIFDGGAIAVLAIGALALAGGILWQIRRRRGRYDLRDLYRESFSGDQADEPDHKGLVDEESGPYCRYCDHPNPPGANFCQSCGQRIA